MPKQREVISQDGVEFASYEELYAYWYFKELKEAGLVDDIICQPAPFKLSDKQTHPYKETLKSGKEKFLDEVFLNDHIYTADFKIKWSSNALNSLFTSLESEEKIKKGNSLVKFISSLILGDYYSYFEVKPIYDQNNMTRLFKINQKWVYDKHKIFVNLFIPEEVFNKTFTPDRFLSQNKGKGLRKIKYKNVVLLRDYLNGLEPF